MGGGVVGAFLPRHRNESPEIDTGVRRELWFGMHLPDKSEVLSLAMSREARVEHGNTRTRNLRRYVADVCLVVRVMATGVSV